MPGMVKCSNPECNEMVLAHRVCKVCGFYGGKQVITLKKKED
jgi:large subunit ribosomal protein L32